MVMFDNMHQVSLKAALPMSHLLYCSNTKPFLIKKKQNVISWKKLKKKWFGLHFSKPGQTHKT